MTPDQQRIAIAEACGWRHIRVYKDGDDSLPVGYPPTLRAQQESRATQSDLEIPDYLNDLNAMHEAEKHLPKDGTSLRYVDALATLQSDHHPFFSTAEEKARAFLIAIGKLA